MMYKCNQIVLIAGLACFSGISQAATIVNDNFDVGLGTWIPNTTETTNTYSATGGNPNGYLSTTNAGTSAGFGAVGAVNDTANYSGVFANGTWTISVDLNFMRGDFTDSWLRFRYQDATANGWHISLDNANFSNTWNTYSVTFNTNWDDATAEAHGWVKESDGTLTATPSFSTLWGNVYTSEVRILGTSGSTLLAGIDNYRASVVPVPAAIWLFGSGLLGLIGIARRKQG